MQTRVIEEPVTVEIQGKREEFRKLYEELHTWTPSGGWSSQAEQFFYELRQAGGIQ